MPGPLEGRVAVVTGASSGIGAATALALAEAGAAVAIGARRADRLGELERQIAGRGGRAVVTEVDVTDEDQARAFVTGAAEQLGGLDILVNNAGVMLLGPVAGADMADWRRMVEVNLLGLLYCTHAAVPIMAEQGSGDIVNVSSVAGRRATAFSAVYNLTKHGVHAFSEALRQELALADVRVTIVAPGMVETELVGHNTNPLVIEGSQKLREEIGEPLRSEDIAAAIVNAVAQPPHVCHNEILVRPTRQRR